MNGAANFELNPKKEMDFNTYLCILYGVFRVGREEMVNEMHPNTY